ncbi:MAG: fused MFS/spermidine synthase [Phycisphaeraceae bacterium]|nr:fused MFS/spermidine synthase [Phycisphaeraceae bacterium]
MLPFAATIFLSAFLLFQVQPIIARYILPWYGGSSAVWTTCMLFFQVMLLVGYAYAHALRLWLKPRHQVWVHLALMGLSLSLLPISPDVALKPVGPQEPTGGILLLLIVSVGMPYLVVSSSGPLLQHWFARSYPGRSPYRLYALSNVGSLLALLSYPFLVEPTLELGQQAVIWTVGYVLYVIGAAVCGGWVHRRAAGMTPDESDAEAPVESAPPTWQCRLMWVMLAACGSAALLAVTNQVCQDIAVVPFLWILPLSLYLVSFIICFDREIWYARFIWVPAFVLSLSLAVVALSLGSDASIYLQVIAFNLFLFCTCMVCHGELVKTKPDPSRLTSFYLLISLGGALGGAFVSLAAPRLFSSGYWEMHTVMLAVYILLGWRLMAGRPWGSGRPPKWVWMTVWVAGAGGLSFFLSQHVGSKRENLLAVSRNFYGVLRVREYNRLGPDDPPDTLEAVKKDIAWQRTLAHGGIQHGSQLMDPRFRRWPTSYYGRGTGVFLAIKEQPLQTRGLHVGVVGLGTGTLAALARPSDRFEYYEINPEVVRICRTYFTYLSDSPAPIRISLGDARIVMEQQLAEEGGRQFDVLVIDAFSSDAIPIHLLTAEAMQLYIRHLKRDGILAVHISNRHLNLRPVVRALADQVGRKALWINNDEDPSRSVSNSDWVLVTSNRLFLSLKQVRDRVEPWLDERKILWTDDFHSLVGVLRK